MSGRDEAVAIRAGDAELALRPGVGGSVQSFRVAGVEILRATDPGARDARALAGFPLLPFSGRIDRGRFTFRGREVRLRPNFPPEPHAIHGTSWQQAWRVADREARGIRLVFEHDAVDAPGAWPWRYGAEQRFRLEPRRLHLALSITNRSDEPMPAGLGWHPYLPVARSGPAWLEADVTEVWRSGDAMIPSGPTALTEATDLRRPRDVTGLALDDAFGVGAEPSLIAWPEDGVRLRLASSDLLRHLVVYTPVGGSFFCVEPTSHAPDAVNSRLPPDRTGLRELAPGATLSAEIRLDIEAVGPGRS
jgi:aldose 1-epimerase